MLEDFQKHINDQFSFLNSKRLLLAVSGGVDSMVLLQLCLAGKYEIAVAHCNFRLRGEESDRDATFVKSYCRHHHITYHQKEFETKDYAADKKISTQMAARDLRYEWFEELLEVHNYDHIVTAHHLNDDLETFLINFGRGTGLKGLLGIPTLHGKRVRPLLLFSRKRILAYAQDNNISWREDSSNATDDYLRNHLRHHAIPALEAAHPKFLGGFEKTKQNLKQSAALLKVYQEQLRQQYTYPIHSIQGASAIGINLEALEQHPEHQAVLYALLETYGFTAWDDIYTLTKAQSGKQVFSKTHRLIKSRNALEVYLLKEVGEKSIEWAEGKASVSIPIGKLTLDNPKNFETIGKKSIIVQSELLAFPLRIRKWEEGDYFYPFGMKGKKKLSKFFKDEKLSLIDKENAWLLCSKGNIVWVIGYRADDRFKVTDVSQKMTRLTISYDSQDN